jgi:hypothetical protein
VTRTEATVEQALLVLDQSGLNLRGQSDALYANRERAEAVSRLCAAFGTPPESVKCPLAIFAQPFGPASAAVVQVADQPGGGLGFRVLILDRAIYIEFFRDPFAVSDRFPPDWRAGGLLPSLTLPLDPPPRRTVAHLQKVLETGGSPTLLGSVQALVDGGRLYFERAAPAPELTRDIWRLLPDSVQAELWPASFAFANDLRFDLLVVPKAEGIALDRYVNEAQALDYPEGQYEFNLQYAVERGDQREVDRLLGRRSGKQMLRFLILLLIFGALSYLAINVLLRFI